MTDVFDTWPNGKPEQVDLQIHPTRWDTVEALWAELGSAWADAEGWLCRPHRVEAWPAAERGGDVLSAELHRADGVSLHVRRTGDGWGGWTYRESPSGELACFRVRLVGTVPDQEGRKLGYAVYWRREPENGLPVYRPYAARFTGWESQ